MTLVGIEIDKEVDDRLSDRAVLMLVGREIDIDVDDRVSDRAVLTLVGSEVDREVSPKLKDSEPDDIPVGMEVGRDIDVDGRMLGKPVLMDKGREIE